MARLFFFVVDEKYAISGELMVFVIQQVQTQKWRKPVFGDGPEGIVLHEFSGIVAFQLKQGDAYVFAVVCIIHEGVVLRKQHTGGTLKIFFLKPRKEVTAGNKNNEASKQ